MTKRALWGLFFIALAISFTSVYFEFVVGLLPCPLCIMQRLAIFLLTLSLFLRLVLPFAKARCLFAISSIGFSWLGFFFALRQVYLQSLPMDKVPACGPSLDILIQYFPWQDVMHALFYGTGDCAKVDWTFLGGSMALWSLVAFAFFAVVLSLEGRLRSAKAKREQR